MQRAYNESQRDPILFLPLLRLQTDKFPSVNNYMAKEGCFLYK